MPRQARIDTAGVLHYIIARGIEKSAIFKDNKNRHSIYVNQSKIKPRQHFGVVGAVVAIIGF
jgi:hypothetical protein